MTRTRLVAVVAGAVLLAVACGGATTDGDTSTSETTAATNDEPADPTESRASGAAESDPEPEPEPTPTPEPELLSPTESDRPFDLDGGATSSDEGVTVVDTDPRADLDENVAAATEPWPTDWTRRTVDVGELFLGIGRLDPRDAIPPIDQPRFETIDRAGAWLTPAEPGALVQFGGEVRFYPLAILTRHEVVNDRIGDVPIVVTYCPLCNTAISFDRRVDGEVLRFGVSGLLRRSDLVMWDDRSTSLWQQITGEGIVGELAGTELELIPTAIVSYVDVAESFPDAVSLSPDTGFGIPYGINPYEGYSSRSQPYEIFATGVDERFPALERVVGVDLGGGKAYPFSVITEEAAVNDEVDGTPVAVFWGGSTLDALDRPRISQSQAIGTGIAFDRRVDGQVLTFTGLDDRFTDVETGSTWNLLGQAVDGPLAGQQLALVPHRNEFWFAWSGFFPDAPVYVGLG